MKIKYFVGILCIAHAIANPSVIEKARVIGPVIPAQGNYGFIVSVQKNNAHICGGVILNGRTILTAATCVKDQASGAISIIAGEVDLTGNGKRFQVESITAKNPTGTEFSKDNIALLRTTQSIEKTKYIDYIDLPAENVHGNIKARVCGWGTSSIGGNPISNLMHCIDGTIMNTTECQATSPYVDDSNICMRTIGSETGPCEFDAGGALFGLGRPTTLMGIATKHLSCGLDIPDIYTRVFAYKEWIKENSGTTFVSNKMALWILLIIPLFIPFSLFFE